MTAAPQGYLERRITAQDGLALSYRHYGDAVSEKTPLLCLAGLTRNAKDFHGLARRYAPERRVLALDLRGRGRSAYDPDWRNYAPEVYLRDVAHLLAAENAHRVIVVGTSLGGLLAMGLAVSLPSALKAVVLNDIGPEIDPGGIARIKSYVGRETELGDWDAATRRLKELFGVSWPDLPEGRWNELAREHFREGPDGRPAMDYDPAIRRPFEANDDSPDMWPLFGALEKVPTLLIRGALSDILSEATATAMAEVKPDLIRVDVANRGHVPLLDEPECLAALDDFIARH
jgi:pimeloyl-ACP methyl ester carboxylesterase